MLGFRGAARYAHPAYAAGFALECAALRRVRDYMGLTMSASWFRSAGGGRSATRPRRDGQAMVLNAERTDSKFT